jgi:hypothetical protein
MLSLLQGACIVRVKNLLAAPALAAEDKEAGSSSWSILKQFAFVLTEDTHQEQPERKLSASQPLVGFSPTYQTQTSES